MKILSSIVAGFLLLSLFTACRKEQNNQASSSDVNIVISSPGAGHLYRSGDSIVISATASYNGVMHGYEVKVTDTTNGNVVFDYAEHGHANNFTIRQAFILTANTPFVMKLTLRTDIDHNNDYAQKDVIYLYQP